MKRILPILLISAVTTAFAQAPITNYTFKFTIKNVPDSLRDTAYLANYYGNRQYYKDTAYFEGNTITLKGDTMVGGIYSIIFGDRQTYFEFVVNEPSIEMETDFKDLTPKMVVKKSEENKAFYEYLNEVNRIAKKAGPISEKLKSLEEGQDKLEKDLREELSKIEKDVNAYKRSFIASHPDLFVTKVFTTTADPEVSDFEEIKDEDERKKKKYYAFKNAYLKDVDFTDDRLLRTPVLHNKMMHYMTKLTAQVPDSIIAAADMIIERARPNKEVFKYAVHTITNKYEDSKVMGMDAVLVHMGETYYCSGDAYWMSKKKLDEFCKRIAKMKPILIGNQAPNLILLDTNGQWQELYKIDAPYTVLYFWDSGCGHCKKVTPKLVDFYNEYKAKGVQVYAVGTEFETKDWIKYIRKNDLPFINVSDTPDANENAQQLIMEGKTTLKSLNFRDTYDIFSTPRLFLLDKDKKIIATKLSPEQLGDFIDHDMDSKKDS